MEKIPTGGSSPNLAFPLLHSDTALMTGLRWKPTWNLAAHQKPMAFCVARQVVNHWVRVAIVGQGVLS